MGSGGQRLLLPKPEKDKSFVLPEVTLFLCSKKIMKYVILLGNYGSGKTEISLNMAINAANEGKKTVLVDMDIVNPYFRSSESEKMLNEKGIKVIKPCFANTMVDVPSLPPDIYTPFDSECDFAVFDAGGDPVGAAALGVLSEYFTRAEEETEAYYVVNTLRPLQDSPQSILDMLYQIQSRSGAKITGIINNTNLSIDTTPEMLEESQKIVSEVCILSGINQVYISGTEEILKRIPDFKIPFFTIKTYTRPTWLDL